MARRAGVLIPLFSLRNSSDWGVGEIPDLAPFAAWAASAGFSVVQMLPVNEAAGGQNSPYAALSAFAIDPVLISMDRVEDFAGAGGLSAMSDEDRSDHEQVKASPSIRWQKVKRLKARALEIAFGRFHDREWKTQSVRAKAFQAYCREHAEWLDDYALFSAIHDQRSGAAWQDWEAPLRDRDPDALDAARSGLERDVLFRRYVQWQLDLQWREARSSANRLGVDLMGDVPFMVAGDSADVWSRPGDFRLDARVGVPPDGFSSEGQDWGLPVYRWDEMERNNFFWMNARARRGAELFGLYRIDHVVGLYRTYYRPNDGGAAAFTPPTEPEQIANGERQMRILAQGAQVIAEDLGTVPDFVRHSLTRLQIPGYRVLRWEKDDHVFRDPAQWPALSVATTGTHDHEPLADWYDQMPADERRELLEIPGLHPLRDRGAERFDPGARDAILELVYQAPSELALIPFQDLSGARERINLPGTVNDENWSYRTPMSIADLAADKASNRRLAELSSRSGRASRGAGASE